MQETSFQRLPDDIQYSVLSALEDEVTQAALARDESHARGALSPEESRQLDEAVSRTEALMNSLLGAPTAGVE